MKEYKNIQNLKEHPHSHLIPEMTKEEFDSLLLNIKQQGILQPIEISNNLIIDSKHRWLAAKELNIDKIPIREISPKNILEYIFEITLKRRHLTEEQKIAFVLKCEDIVGELEKKAFRREKAGKKIGPTEKIQEGSKGEVAEKIALIAGSNLQTVYHIKKVKEKDSEQFEKISKGEIKAKAAYKEIKKQEQQKEIIEKASHYEEEDSIKIIHGDFREVTKQFEDNSIDHIITDPCYGKEHLPLWSDLSRIASRLLKPGGFCITYSGTFHLPEVLNRLAEHLEYYWEMILLHSGQTQIFHSRNIDIKHKSILVFSKPPIKKHPNIVPSVIQGSGRTKELHLWQQSEFEMHEIFKKFTEEGNLILDPMAGSFITAIVSYKLRRKYIGIDIKEENTMVGKGLIEEIKED